MTDPFIDAVQAVVDSELHSVSCDAAPHTYFGAICDCQTNGCSCDREARIIKKIAGGLREVCIELVVGSDTLESANRDALAAFQTIIDSAVNTSDTSE